MTLSLNEVDAMAKRAARGAGHPWGIAEEAAKATRWLCAQGLDGVSILAQVLAYQGDASCPLIAGITLSDRSADLTGAEVALTNIAQPMMVLPFAALAARQTGQTLTVTCGQAKATTTGVHLTATDAFPDIASHLVIQPGGDVAPNDIVSRAAPMPQAWETLQQLAHRTYAPATEESRRLGAGAGLSDTD